ncbi:MerR family DNA-binding transcriptional regulator [Streptomyces tendae]|uniref:MerR family DNA-binding transcriptional regulator n=1 Tax=Streptomyces tendae TaxID=1932 RepID=UPI0036CEB471
MKNRTGRRIRRPHSPVPAGKPPRPWIVRAGIAAAVVVAYFLLPLDHPGPQRPVLSWVLSALLLTVVAVLLLRQIRHVFLDRPDSRPGVAISLLIVLSVHVFSATYYALAKSRASSADCSSLGRTPRWSPMTHATEGTRRIGALARETGLSIRTLRHCDRLGLLTADGPAAPGVRAAPRRVRRPGGGCAGPEACLCPPRWEHYCRHALVNGKPV